MPTGKHAKGKKITTLWIDEKILNQIDEQANQKGYPRSVVLENLVRAHVGMPPIEPSPYTPRKVIPKTKAKSKKQAKT